MIKNKAHQQPVNIISYLSIQILYLTAIYNFKMRLIIVCLILTLTLSAVIQLSKQINRKRLYRIKSQNNHCLDEHGGGAVTAPLCNGGYYQKWWARDAGDGYITFQSYISRNYLDSNGAGGVYTLPGNGGWFQQWIILYQELTVLRNRATGRYLYGGFYSDNVQTLATDANSYSFEDITPEFDCPQMDRYIGNANGKLTFGKDFSKNCWSIEYWKSDKGVTVGAQCWTDDRKSSKWSTMKWQAFGQCL